MNFSQLVTAMWRNRVMVAVGLALSVVALFVLLFVFSPTFQAGVITWALGAFQAVIIFSIIVFGLSLMWKGSVANFKGGGGGGKGKK